MRIIKLSILVLFIISVVLVSGCGSDSTEYKTKELTWWDTPAGQELINLNNSTKSQSTWWDTPEAQRIIYGTPRYSSQDVGSGYGSYNSSPTYSYPSTYSSNSISECKGYSGPGGPCYTGPGGGLYTGPGGGAYAGPGGGAYTGPGGGLYTGPGGGAYTGPGGGAYTGPGGGAYAGPGGPCYSGPGGKSSDKWNRPSPFCK